MAKLLNKKIELNAQIFILLNFFFEQEICKATVKQNRIKYTNIYFILFLF